MIGLIKQLKKLRCGEARGSQVWKEGLLPAVLAPSSPPFFFFFWLKRPKKLVLHPWHKGIPRLGITLELQLLAYATDTATPDPSHIFDLHHSSPQRQILNPLNEARDQTRILVDASWVLSPAPQRELSNLVPSAGYCGSTRMSVLPA